MSHLCVCAGRYNRLPADPNVTRLCRELISRPSSSRRHLASCRLQFFDPERPAGPVSALCPKSLEVRFRNMARFKGHAQVVHGDIIPQPKKPSQ